MPTTVTSQPRGSMNASNPAMAPMFSAQNANMASDKVTDSGQVKLKMSGKESGTGTGTGANMMATALITSRLKSNLERKRSLNPRMMPPPGLEVLDDQPLIAVRQQMEVDKYGGCGAPNTYRLVDQGSEQLFLATEESGCLCRWACGPARQFSLDVFSSQEDPVLNFHRTACRCDWCCCADCFLCLQKMYIVDCLGRTLGAVKQKFSVFSAKFDIVDHDDNVLFKVQGPCCACRCSTELYFKVLSKTGDQQVGKIQKKWGGDRPDNINVDHEYFEVAFAPSLDIVDKGLILGAGFLVNIMYFEMS